MEVVIDPTKVTITTASYAYGVTGSDMLKVDYKLTDSAGKRAYVVYIQRKAGDPIAIDLSSSITGQPTWTNTQTGAEQAVADLSVVMAECCGGGGGGAIESITGTAPISVTAGANPVVSHDTSGVAAGSYTNANITVDAEGHITSASNGSAVDDHLVIASLADGVPGTLQDKLEITGFTSSIINPGADEILRFTQTGPAPSGPGFVNVALYEAAGGTNTVSASGAWTDIVCATPVRTSTDISIAGSEFTFLQEGSYFLAFKFVSSTGASRTQAKVRIVVDTGSGYNELDTSLSYAYTPNSFNDLQTAYTGIIPFDASIGDKFKVQAAVSSGVLPLTNAADTAALVFRVQTNFTGASVFTDLLDVPSSYTGEALKVVRVNAAETGLEFVAGGGSGITQLTGDVTAGPGSGSQAATLANTPVTPGSYTNASITVDAKGRLTAASNGAAPVTSVGASSPLASSGGSTPTISHNDSGVTPATYGSATQSPQIAIDAKGHVTSASPVTITPAVGSITGLGTGVSTALSNNADSASGFVTQAGGDARYARLYAPSFITYTGGNQNTTSTSFADIHSSAGWNSVAPGFYRFEARIAHNSAATTTGAAFVLNGTITQDYLSGAMFYSTNTGDRGAYVMNGTLNTGQASSSSVSSGTTIGATITGHINVTATGDIRIAFATEVAGSQIQVTNVIGFLQRLF